MESTSIKCLFGVKSLNEALMSKNFIQRDYLQAETSQQFVMDDT